MVFTPAARRAPMARLRQVAIARGPFLGNRACRVPGALPSAKITTNRASHAYAEALGVKPERFSALYGTQARTKRTTSRVGIKPSARSCRVVMPRAMSRHVV